MKAETALGEVDMLTVICFSNSLEWIKRRGKESYQGAEIRERKVDTVTIFLILLCLPMTFHYF